MVKMMELGIWKEIVEESVYSTNRENGGGKARALPSSDADRMTS